jgi:hypothetical protein
MAKHRKSNKYTKKSKKNMHSKKSHRGGCGCRKNAGYLSIMQGGYGSSNLSSLDSRNYYNLTNPNDLPAPISSRNTIMGGKKTKKMRGGNILPNWLTNHPFGNNSLIYTGDTAGAFLGSNVYNGISNSSNSITNGPLLNPNRTSII